MDLFLAPAVFAAVRAEDLVILDAAAGEYLLLPGAGVGVVVAADSNRLAGAGQELKDALTGAGLLGVDPTPQPRPALPPPPARDLGSEFGAGVSASELLSWGLAGADMAHGYWRSPFPVLVDWARTLAAQDLGADPMRLARASQAFRRLLPWVPFQGECLFRSLMLRAYLRRQGLTAAWVVGCRTWPFEAHCWLQAGDLVLDDAADHAASFTALMVVP